LSLERLKRDLVTLGKMGRKQPIATEKYEDLDNSKGLWRVEGSIQAAISRDYIINEMKKAGLNVKLDRVGNVFGERKGSKPDKKVVMFGSHLDSAKNGGQFDGPLGIVTGLEGIRNIQDEGFKNERTLVLVAFMGEEASAFKPAILGSRVMMGMIPVNKALSLKNNEGTSLKEVLDKTGHKGKFDYNIDNIAYFLELHIEQGPILDKEKIPIGIVENITGYTWIDVEIVGEENHAGGTPMNMRRDPLLAASDIVLFVNHSANEILRKHGGSTVATAGKVNVFPSATNIIPGKVDVGIDIRDCSNQNLKTLKEKIINHIKELERKYNVETSKMNSGSTHDALHIARKAKMGMIFVPSVNGISHAPMEWTNWEDIEKGLNVMTDVLKRLSLK